MTTKRPRCSELQVKDFLTLNNITFIHNKKYSTTSFRPDFLISLDDRHIYVEIDERYHREQVSKDFERMRLIAKTTLSEKKNTIFIRVGAKSGGMYSWDRLCKIKVRIDHWTTTIIQTTPQLIISYLFYPRKLIRNRIDIFNSMYSNYSLSEYVTFSRDNHPKPEEVVYTKSLGNWKFDPNEIDVIDGVESNDTQYDIFSEDYNQEVDPNFDWNDIVEL